MFYGITCALPGASKFVGKANLFIEPPGVYEGRDSRNKPQPIWRRAAERPASAIRRLIPPPTNSLRVSQFSARRHNPETIKDTMYHARQFILWFFLFIYWFIISTLLEEIVHVQTGTFNLMENCDYKCMDFCSKFTVID